MSDQADLAKANERIKELHTLLPEARVGLFAGRADRKWRAFARLSFSVDGTTENGVTGECLLSTAATWPECLEKAYELAHDAKRQLHFRDRHIRGLPLDLEPPPLTPEQLERSKEDSRRMKIAQERALEGMRNHMREHLKARGLTDLAKERHRKTGMFPNLFSAIGSFFDVGRR